MMETIDDLKREFLSKEFWILSWAASVQRALKYNEAVTEKERRLFKQAVIGFCETQILPMYQDEVSEAEHKKNIQKICAHVETLDDANILARTYNIGIAQKLLNMQLKYLWVSSNIPRPPHCPIDRIILSKTSLKNKLNWTQIETLDVYQQAIHAVLAVAKPQHIAEWELHTFNRR